MFVCLMPWAARAYDWSIRSTASETVTATAIVAIYKALDGGWDASGTERVGGSGK